MLRTVIMFLFSVRISVKLVGQLIDKVVPVSPCICCLIIEPKCKDNKAVKVQSIQQLTDFYVDDDTAKMSTNFRI